MAIIDSAKTGEIISEPLLQILAQDGTIRPLMKSSLAEDIQSLQVRVIAELYGEPIPELTAQLLQSARGTLETEPSQHTALEMDDEYGKYIHFTTELPGGGGITATLSQKHNAVYELSKRSSGNESNYSTNLVIRAKAGKNSSVKELEIALENVKNGVSDPDYPYVLLDYSVIYKQSKYYRAALRREIGREVKEDSEDSTKLYPSLEGVENLSDTRKLGELDKLAVEWVIKMMIDGSRDSSDNPFSGSKSKEIGISTANPAIWQTGPVNPENGGDQHGVAHRPVQELTDGI